MFAPTSDSPAFILHLLSKDSMQFVLLLLLQWLLLVRYLHPYLADVMKEKEEKEAWPAGPQGAIPQKPLF